MDVETEGIPVLANFTDNNNLVMIENMLVVNGPKLLKAINLEDLTHAHRLHIKNRMIATLLHIKNSSNKVINCKDTKSKATKENVCYRFLLLADEELETFGIIIKNNTLGNVCLNSTPSSQLEIRFCCQGLSSKVSLKR